MGNAGNMGMGGMGMGAGGMPGMGMGMGGMGMGMGGLGETPGMGGNSQNTLYVGNLDEIVNEEILFNFFINYGRIQSIKVMRRPDNFESRGFGFITFMN
jgi:hypothetical protein